MQVSIHIPPPQCSNLEHRRTQANLSMCLWIGWAKYMTWKYPVTVEITNKPAFKGAGAVAAAATLWADGADFVELVSKRAWDEIYPQI